MSNETVTRIVEIQTEQAVQSLDNIKESTDRASKSWKTLGEYRKYIDKMTASLLTLDESSEEYARTVEEIKNAQNKLNSVLDSTKKKNDLIEGSYNALVYQMSELKKQWKATGDEAERARLGEQILGINNQLKELDASTGNFQRNVGNYGNAFKTAFLDMADGIEVVNPKLSFIKTTIEKVIHTLEGAKGMKDVLSNAIWSGKDIAVSVTGVDIFTKRNKAIKEGTEETIKATRATRNWQAGEVGLQTAEAVTTALTLKTVKSTSTLISEYEKASKSSYKMAAALQALRDSGLDVIRNSDKIVDRVTRVEYSLKATKDSMIAINTVTGHTINITDKYIAELGKLQDSEYAAQNAIYSFGDSVKEVGQKLSTLAKIGIGATIAAITALIAVAATMITKAVKARKELLEFRTELNKGSEGAADQVIALMKLSDAYKALGDSADAKKKFLKENAEQLKELGLVTTDVNLADDLFIRNTDKYIEALMNRAKAEAATAYAAEEWKKSIEEIAEIQAKMADAPDEGYYQYSANNSITGSTGVAFKVKGKDEYQEEIDAITKKTEEKIKEILEFSKNAEDAANSVLSVFTTIEEETTTPTKTKEIEIFPSFKIDYQKLVKEWISGLHYGFEEVDDETYRELDKYKADIDARWEELNNMSKDSESPWKQLFDVGGMDTSYATQAYRDQLNELADYEWAYLENKLAAEGATDEEILNEKEKYYAKINKLQKKSAQDEKKLRQQTTQTYISSIGTIMGAIADMCEEGSDEYKAFAIMETSLNMLSGVMSAVTSAMSPANAYMSIYGQMALAAAASAAVIATGIAQIAKISQTTLGDGGSSATSAEPVSAVTSYTPQVTSSVTGESETVNLANAIGEQKVYVVESDIADVGRRVSVRDKEASF